MGILVNQNCKVFEGDRLAGVDCKTPYLADMSFKCLHHSHIGVWPDKILTLHPFDGIGQHRRVQDHASFVDDFPQTEAP